MLAHISQSLSLSPSQPIALGEFGTLVHLSLLAKSREDVQRRELRIRCPLSWKGRAN